MKTPPDTRALPGRGTRALIAIGMVIPLLAGCSLLEGPSPEVPKRETPAPPEQTPEYVPDGSAEQNLPFFRSVLTDYAAGTGAVQGKPIARAVIDAGFAPDAMQVSFDRTKTDLPADNIFVSVRIGPECLIGQVVAEDRSVVAETAPAVGPEKNLCLIGETAPVE